MTRNLFIPFLLMLLGACNSSQPFISALPKSDALLEDHINIEGCYVFQRECDADFFSVVCFLPEGKFMIATTSNPTTFVDYFCGKSTSSNIRQYVSTGEYVLVGDTIKTQTIRKEGIAQCPIYREYLILPDKNLTNISDYVLPEKGNIGYMRNYPSFRDNPCPQAASFYFFQDSEL